MATACWDFPIYSQTFVYQELTQLATRGFSLRFIYSKINPRKNLPTQFAHRLACETAAHPPPPRVRAGVYVLREPDARPGRPSRRARVRRFGHVRGRGPPTSSLPAGFRVHPYGGSLSAGLPALLFLL